MVREVVVTGGGTGIGYALADAFARGGDRVTITGRREHVLREAAGRIGAHPVVFDASDPAAVTAALGALPERVDVLVHNAGGNTDFDRPDPGDDLAAVAANWTANFAANVLSTILVTTALRDRFTDDARIVALGSIAARQGAGGYGAAKAAVEAWAADVSRELGPRGITVNVVSPGYVADTEFFRSPRSDEWLRPRLAATRNGRAGLPADIVAAVRYLAAPEAGHVTGQVLHVNGGAYLGR